jgi:hypothetical protein
VAENPSLLRIDDYEAAAAERLPRDVYDYYAGVDGIVVSNHGG